MTSGSRRFNNSQAERLLESFAKRSGLVPETAYRIRDRKALPENLRQRLTQVLQHSWLCFSDGSRLWMVTGMVSVALSQERNAPVLWINAYSENGAPIEVGAWTVDNDGTWQRCGD